MLHFRSGRFTSFCINNNSISTNDFSLTGSMALPPINNPTLLNPLNSSPDT